MIWKLHKKYIGDLNLTKNKIENIDMDTESFGLSFTAIKALINDLKQFSKCLDIS